MAWKERRNMRTYISAPRSDEEIEALEKRVEELEAKLREAEERAALGEKPPGPTNRPTDTELATMSWFDLRREAERARAAELKLTVGLDQARTAYRLEAESVVQFGAQLEVERAQRAELEAKLREDR